MDLNKSLIYPSLPRTATRLEISFGFCLQLWYTLGSAWERTKYSEVYKKLMRTNLNSALFSPVDHMTPATLLV